MQDTTALSQRWAEIEAAGGIRAYIETQLRTQGYLVTRRPTDNLTKTELEAYKHDLKREAVAKRRLRQAAWQAYRTTHIVHLGAGVYWTDDTSADRWDLPSGAKRLLENQLPVLTTANSLAEDLNISVTELRWLSYHREDSTQTHYVRFEIPKRSGGTRALWAPHPRLKQVQRWILRNILDRLLVHGAAHGFLAGRSIASNAALHTDSQLIVKLDIENFFPSISWRRVKGVLRKAGYQDNIATLLALLCTEAPRAVVNDAGKTHYIALGERCLPQGAPTSPALTNALCLRLDQRLTGWADKAGWRYTRYADDLTFSYPASANPAPEPQRLIGVVQHILAEEGFKLNMAKTRCLRPGVAQRVTGLVVNGNSPPRVGRTLKRTLRAALHNLKQGKPLPEGESLSRLRGLGAYVAMTEREWGMSYLAELAQLAQGKAG